MSDEKTMKIAVEVPADDYALISKRDLGRVMGVLKHAGLQEHTQDVKVRWVRYRDPGVSAIADKLTKAQRKNLRQLLERKPVYTLTRGKWAGAPGDTSGFNRRALDCLVDMGLAAASEGGTSERKRVYTITEEGIRVAAEVRE